MVSGLSQFLNFLNAVRSLGAVRNSGFSLTGTVGTPASLEVKDFFRRHLPTPVVDIMGVLRTCRNHWGR